MINKMIVGMIEKETNAKTNFVFNLEPSNLLRLSKNSFTMFLKTKKHSNKINMTLTLMRLKKNTLLTKGSLKLTSNNFFSNKSNPIKAAVIIKIVRISCFLFFNSFL